MRGKRVRLLAAVLAMVLTLNLTACKDKTPKPEDLAFQAAPGYLQEDVTLPVDTGELIGACTDNESFWFWTTREEGALPSIWRAPLDGQDAELLAEYEPLAVNEEDTMGYIGPVLGGDGKLWIWEQKIAHLSGSVAETFQMRQLEPDSGRTLKTLDITAAMQVLSKTSFNGIAVDAAGTLFLADSKQIAAIDGNGQIEYTIKADLPGTFPSENAAGTLALLPDGTVGAVTVQAGDKRAVCRIDPENRKLADKKYAVPSGVDEIYAGQAPCLFYYTNNNALFGVVEGEELPQRLLPWYNTQVESAGDVKCFVLMEESCAAFLTWTRPTVSAADRYNGQIRAIRLQPTDEPPQDGRVRLVYGTIGEDPSLLFEIKKFNRSNTEYYVELRDYSEGMLAYRETDSQLYQSAVTRLFVDITKGEGPDILGYNIPLETLSRQGALEDLWPYIENDPELGREAVMEHVLECMETGGGELHRLCKSFAIQTAVASVERAGNRTGWTMDEMLAAYGGKLPDMYFVSSSPMFSGGDDYKMPIFAKIDKGTTLRNLVSMSLDSYVDWETGACSFDSEDFRNLLRLTDTTDDPDGEMDLSNYLTEQAYGDLIEMDVNGVELCQVFPWDGGPILYSRKLQGPMDLVMDDALFGGRDTVAEDYPQRLWDSGLYISSPIEEGPNAGTTQLSSTDDIENVFRMFGDLNFIKWRNTGYSVAAAADVVIGAADGNIYASFIGFPASGGSGSSFSVQNCEAISSMSQAKDGAWEFIRRVLLPGGSLKAWDYDDSFPFADGFPLNRADFEEQIAKEYFVRQSTGEYFYDAEGRSEERVDL